MNDDREKILSMLGMARRAGKLSTGFEAVKESVKRKKAKLILCSCDLSAKTVKELEFAAKNFVTVITTDFSMTDISIAVGTKTGCVALCDRGFAEAVNQRINSLEEEQPNDN